MQTKTYLSPLLMAAILGLSACNSDSSRVGGGSSTQARLMIIGMDGTRAEALDIAATPNLDSLRTRGIADLNAITGDVSLSGPGWASMLTGVWCDKHHVIDNDASWAQSQFDLYPHFIQRLEDVNPALTTVSISHWAAINDEIVCADESQTDCSGADLVMNTDTDAEVRDQVVDQLVNADPHVIFMQFDDIDHAGHGDPAQIDPGGFCPFSGGDLAEGEEGGVCTPLTYNPNYLQTLETTDGYIGDILTALYARPGFAQENWLIMVSPDHGGAGVVSNQHGFNASQDRRTFLIMVGDAVTSFPESVQIKIVDIAATALQHMGLSLEPDWNLDGQAVGLSGAAPYEERSIPSCYDPTVFVPDSRS